MKTITLAHGSGGQAMQQLIANLFMDAFTNPWLAEQEDAARLPLSALTANGDRLAFSTDSYVIDPLFFPGGDIGKLAICGTANDIAVSGAQPRWLSCGFILEEGLPLDTLERIVRQMAQTAQDAGIAIVTGDTKVVPRGAADKIFINTAGIGAISPSLHWGTNQIEKDDVIIVSGTLGDHGATILNLREQLGLEGELTSDCAVLAPMIQTLWSIPGIKALRDATRGGVNAVLHEFAAMSGYGMEISEATLPINAAVRGVCELLGLDPLNFANEGKLVIIASRQAAPTVLETLHQHPLGHNAAAIGDVTVQHGVRTIGLYGVKRSLNLPHAEPLPRIC
ncbi:hydrogenase expression/formation protein HypE [Samsonia erythrinae]|uniref:Hydrogenase maturation carbamoyl dehydratase HypE n=1 Tax=Samsonia erythrinae TaxID=160434 RepID=A0A4R3VPL1_9GAMM|nr:hydrogenase expression/formation protein HypE [Samsonia erythrinae]TCV06278.1 hydrogenase maturation carbamoyl dehydratase HypE [Samsonia erythrinae]